MMSAQEDITMRSHDYGESKSSKDKGAPDSIEPLHITRPPIEPIPQMPKGSSECLIINPIDHSSL